LAVTTESQQPPSSKTMCKTNPCVGFAFKKLFGSEENKDLLTRQLERRFGTLPQWATEKLIRASEHELETWGDTILTAQTLDALFTTDETRS